MMYIILVLFLTTFPAHADDLMPKVKYLSKEDVQAYFCSDPNCMEVVAFYDKLSRTIVLRDTFDPANEFDLSALIHEFVHHLQNINGEKRSRCRGDRERQAYEVQRTFLKERGHKDTDKVMGIDLFTQFIITQCGE